MAFDRRFARRKTLLKVFGLVKEVKKRDSLTCRNFLIISYRASIYSSYFIYINTIVTAIAEVTILKIKCYSIVSIATGGISKINF